MSRVINPNAAGKERTKIVKAVVIALRELAQQSTIGTSTRDLAAFVALSLEVIAETIDPSVSAWEKKGYWVKADKFRMEWIWTKQYGKALREAILKDEWSQVAILATKTAEKLNNIKVPIRHRIGQPWVGAWENLRLKAQNE